MTISSYTYRGLDGGPPQPRLEGPEDCGDALQLPVSQHGAGEGHVCADPEVLPTVLPLLPVILLFFCPYFLEYFLHIDELWIYWRLKNLQCASIVHNKYSFVTP